jgi:hypothetical protein
MPAMLRADMEAINKYFMEQVTIKTPAAEKIKQEWMAWWKEHKRDWTWYTIEEFDHARNMRNKLNLANATSTAQKAEIAAHIASAKGSREEQMGETRRSGTSGMFLEEEEPIIPTKWKVGAVVGVSLIAAGVFAKQLLKLTPYGRFAKFLP